MPKLRADLSVSDNDDFPGGESLGHSALGPLSEDPGAWKKVWISLVFLQVGAFQRLAVVPDYHL